MASASAVMTGMTRLSSSAESTGTAPCGRVDSPPMSMMSAPSARILSARATAADGEKN